MTAINKLLPSGYIFMPYNGPSHPVPNRDVNKRSVGAEKRIKITSESHPGGSTDTTSPPPVRFCTEEKIKI